jgi:hypothetical protein
MLNTTRYAGYYSTLEQLYCAGTPNLPALREIRDKFLNGVTEAVEITTNSYEGGSATGTIVFERTLGLLAVTRLLGKYDKSLECLLPTPVQTTTWMRPIQP